jgi:tetratricopeptide (TPR) repeat protein
VTFTADVRSAATPGIQPIYKWTISGGKITSGQGTSAITVDTAAMGEISSLRATVDIGGFAAGCQTSKSASIYFQKKSPMDIAKENFETGRQQLLKYEYDAALKSFNECIRLYAEAFGCHILRGEAYIGLAKYDDAILSYSKVIEMAPNIADGYRGRAIAYNWKNDHDSAIKDLTKAIELHPKDSFLYRMRGSSYVNKNELDAALADFTKSIELNAIDTSTFTFRGEAYVKKGNRELAIADFKKAIQLSANNSRAKQKLKELGVEP